MSANLVSFIGALFQSLNNQGSVNSGGSITTYVAGSSSTLAATYTDSTLITANANPMTLNGAGRPVGEFWIASGNAVKVVIKGADGVLLAVYDNLPGTNDVTVGNGLVGDTRNVSMVVATAGATGTMTADEIVVQSALGGVTSVLASFSQSINLATTGAGGMDTGTAPASSFVSLYAIAQPGGLNPALLACAATVSSASIYAGSNMPTGYTLSALVGIWPTNSSSLLVAGVIRDPAGRKFNYSAYPSVFTAHAAITTYTSTSISSQVPAVAKFVSAMFTSDSGAAGDNFGLSSDSIGTGAKQNGCMGFSATKAWPGGVASAKTGGTITDALITSSQTVYVMAQGGGGTNYAMYVSDYSW